MSVVRIIQPRIRTDACGVSDHSAILRRQLESEGVLVYQHSAPTRIEAQSVPIHAGETWFVQFSIYGYASRGIPTWFPVFLRSAKRGGVRLVIYFHELWVTTAPINSSAFWLAPLQKKICQESASLADYGFFNTEWAYRWGKTQLGERAIYSPVFSNVGEPEACPVWDSKSTSVVVFGSGRTRDAIYAAASDMLCMHLRTGTIGQVIDVGAPTDRTSTLASEYGVSAFRACGSLPAHDISLLLASTKFGLFNTPWGLASKSGVFAAYVAHGVAPVSIFDDPGKYSDPTGYPMPDIHFLPKLKFRSSEGELDRLGRTVAASASLDYEPSRRLSAKLIDLLP